MGLATFKIEPKDIGEGIKMHEVPINVLWEDYALTSYEDIYKPPPPGKGLFKAPNGRLRMGGQMNRIHPHSLGPSITPYNGLDGDRPIHPSEAESALLKYITSKKKETASPSSSTASSPASPSFPDIGNEPPTSTSNTNPIPLLPKLKLG